MSKVLYITEGPYTIGEWACCVRGWIFKVKIKRRIALHLENKGPQDLFVSSGRI